MKLKHLVLSLLLVILVALNVVYFNELIKICYDPEVNLCIRFLQVIDILIIGYVLLMLAILIESNWNKKIF